MQYACSEFMCGDQGSQMQGPSYSKLDHATDTAQMISPACKTASATNA